MLLKVELWDIEKDMKIDDAIDEVKNNLDMMKKSKGWSAAMIYEHYWFSDKTLDEVSKDIGISKSTVFLSTKKVRNKLKNNIKNADDIALLKQTNKEYGNMKKIEDVVLKNTQGNISPSLLSNSLATKAKRNALYAEDKELANLARAGKDILEQKLPNSGTMARMLAQNPYYAGTQAIYGKTVQKALNNPNIAQYLEQGIQNKPLRSVLEIPKTVGNVLPIMPGVVGSTALNEFINLRNQGQ